MRTILAAFLMLAFSLSPVLMSASRAEYVSIPPPPLPNYDQPAIPGPGYVWVPGNWAYDKTSGYFWVPGTWVIPPKPGLLWTPSYWRYNKELDAYGFHKGYWAEEVGFYGGIDYGFGYPGTGYHGGYWRDGRFFYNTAVNNLAGATVPDVFSQPVSDATGSPVSFLGGLGGINIQITPQQEAVAKLPHVDRTKDQNKQVQVAKDDPGSFEKNGGPNIGATRTVGDRGNSATHGKGRPRHDGKTSSGGELVQKTPKNEADKGKVNNEAVTQGKGGEANNDRSTAGEGIVAGRQDKTRDGHDNLVKSPADKSKTAGKEGGEANKGKSSNDKGEVAVTHEKNQGGHDNQVKSPPDDVKTAAGKQGGGEAAKLVSPENSHAEGQSQQRRAADEAKVPRLHLMGERSSGRREAPPVRTQSAQRVTNVNDRGSSRGTSGGRVTAARQRQFTTPRVTRVASQRATRFTAPRVSRVAPQRVARFSAPRVNRVAAPRINRAAPPRVNRVAFRPAAGRPQRRR